MPAFDDVGQINFIFPHTLHLLSQNVTVTHKIIIKRCKTNMPEFHFKFTMLVLRKIQNKFRFKGEHE